MEGFEWQSRMVGVFRDQLPHWIAEEGRYAVTLRCRGSLPRETLERLREQVSQTREIDPAHDAVQKEQRRLFLTLEHYLDQGLGFTPFQDRSLASAFSQWLRQYYEEGLHFSDWVAMPNHLHLITHPLRSETCTQFQKTWIAFKKRSTRFLNTALQRKGAFWQRYWFDRWIRDAAEFEKWQRYLEQNPVKANLCRSATEWPGSSSFRG